MSASGRRRLLLRLAERILAACGAVLLLYFLLFDLTYVVTASMEPALLGSGGRNDWVLTEKVTRLFRAPRRFELVAFHNDLGMKVMKRVVALPGESVAIVDDRLTIDGRPLEFPPHLSHLRYEAYGCLFQREDYRLTDGVFLLGDNARDSQDSRFEGALPVARILGHPRLIVWPPARFGFVR